MSSDYTKPIAHVQYDDMTGTCAADFSESATDFLNSIGFNQKGRFVLDLQCFSTYASSFSVTVSFVKANSFDEAKELLKTGAEVFKKEIAVSHADFFKHFKRFSMVLGRKQLFS